MGDTPKSQLGFACVKCGHPVIIFEIPAGQPMPSISGGLTRVLRCSSCFCYAQYHTSQLARFEPGDR